MNSLNKALKECVKRIDKHAKGKSQERSQFKDDMRELFEDAEMFHESEFDNDLPFTDNDYEQ